jgi:hypothetical protein
MNEGQVRFGYPLERFETESKFQMVDYHRGIIFSLTIFYCHQYSWQKDQDKGSSNLLMPSLDQYTNIHKYTYTWWH